MTRPSSNPLLRILLLILLSSLLLPFAAAQFQFFEQMFQGHPQQQHQEPQNVASDSNWYRANYENGRSLPFSVHAFDQANGLYSTLHKLSLPGDPCLRTFPASLPLPFSRGRRQGGAW